MQAPSYLNLSLCGTGCVDDYDSSRSTPCPSVRVASFYMLTIVFHGWFAPFFFLSFLQIEFFCKDHVQYTAACDTDNDPYLGFNPSCNNTFAIQVFSNFQRALSVYSCKEYSRIWTCDNCTEAYKRWLCSALYRRCKQNDTDVSGGQCETNFTRTNSKALPDCIMRTCSDVCYEVVRKCPVHLAFRCPPLSDIREYNVTNCNNMEREAPTAAGLRLRLGGSHVSMHTCSDQVGRTVARGFSQTPPRVI